MTVVRYLAAGTYFLILAAPPSASAQDTSSNLNGEWTSDCLSIGKNDRHGYITRIMVRGEELTATSQVYAKNTCRTPTVQVNFRGKLVTAKADGDRTQIEYVVNSITTTANI